MIAPHSPASSNKGRERLVVVRAIGCIGILPAARRWLHHIGPPRLSGNNDGATAANPVRLRRRAAPAGANLGKQPSPELTMFLIGNTVTARHGRSANRLIKV
jgi:hypothetical protein